MPVNKLNGVTYDDFQLLQTIDPEQFDTNFSELANKTDELIDVVNGLSNDTVIDFGVYPAKQYLQLDSVTDDYTALYNLINTTINGADAEIWFKDGTCLIGTSITIPSNVKLKFLNGGMLKPASGVTVTINGQVEAGLYKIFDITDGGTFAGSPRTYKLYPEWFGAIRDGVTDDSLSINATLSFAYGQSSVGNAYDLTTTYTVYEVAFGKGRYLISTALVGYDYMHLTGTGRGSTQIICSGCNGIEFEEKYHFVIENITFMQSSFAKTTSGIKMTTCARIVLSNVCVRGFNIGYDFYQGFLIDMFGCFAQTCNISVKLDALNNGTGCHAVRFYGGEYTEGVKGISAKFGNGISLFGVTLESFTTSAIYFEDGAQCSPFVIDGCYFEDNLGEIVTDDSDSLKDVKIENCLFTYGGSNVNKKYIWSLGFLGCTITGNVFAYPKVTYDHIDAAGSLTGVYIRDTVIANNRCGDGSAVSIDTGYTTYASADGIDDNYIQNSTTSYDNKLMRGFKVFGDAPYFSHTDGASTANRTQLVFNTDGTIHSKYYRSFSLENRLRGIGLTGQTQLARQTDLAGGATLVDVITAYNNLLADMKSKGFMYSLDTIFDSFNRENNTSTLGTTETGQTWTVSNGVFGISNNSAYRVSGTGIGFAYVETGLADFTLSVKLTSIGTGIGHFLVFRLSDTSNYLLLYVNGSGQYTVYKTVAGVNTLLDTDTSITATANDIIVLTCNGNDISTTVNGSASLSCTDAFNNSETKHGIVTSDSSKDVKYDYFRVKSLS
jgi:hypothetical protein